MSWTDRLAELYELLVGLGVAAAVLAIVAWFISAAGSTDRHGKGTRTQQPSAGPSPENDPTQDQRRGENSGLPSVAALYIAAEAAQPMERVERVVAVAGRGLAGDRYFLERGHWSGTDGCEVTIIAQEDIDEIERRSSVQVQNGQHRRNIVTRNLPVEILAGKRFRIGSASFGYERPRPPCAYIQMVSEPGMTRALGRRAGICVRCIRGGEILEGDQIVILSVTPLQALRYRAKVILQRWQSKNRGHR
jgi:MOSC domain-containing protein YiiM